MIQLQTHLNELGIMENVRFDAERDDIRSLMAFADGGVVSSIDSEVICRVAVEFFSVVMDICFTTRLIISSFNTVQFFFWETIYKGF